MAKKRKESDLVMHKVMGDHKMVTTKICEVCGVTEGQQVIEPFEPVQFTADQIFELLGAIKRLSEQVEQLRQAQVYNDRERWEQEKRREIERGRERPWQEPWKRDLVPVPWKDKGEYTFPKDLEDLLQDKVKLSGEATKAQYEKEYKKSLGLKPIGTTKAAK